MAMTSYELEWPPVRPGGGEDQELGCVLHLPRPGFMRTYAHASCKAVVPHLQSGDKKSCPPQRAAGRIK